MIKKDMSSQRCLAIANNYIFDTDESLLGPLIEKNISAVLVLLYDMKQLILKVRTSFIFWIMTTTTNRLTLVFNHNKIIRTNKILTLTELVDRSNSRFATLRKR